MISTRVASSLWHLVAEDWPVPTILNQNQLVITSEGGETIGFFFLNGKESMNDESLSQ